MSTEQHSFFNGIGHSSISQSLPNQHLNKAQKNKGWVKSCLDRLEQIGVKQLHTNMEFNDYYNMQQGNMVYADYGLPDLTKDIVDLRNQGGMPVTHRHYDFLGIIVNQIKGEYSKLKDTYRIDTIDAISQNEFLRDRKEALDNYTKQTTDNYIKRKLVERGFEFKEQFASEEERQQYLQQLDQEKARIIPPEKIEEEMAKSWKTVAAEWASETLEYDHLRTDFNLDEIEDEEVVDYILTGRFFRHYHVGYDFYKPERWDTRTTFFSQDVEAKYPNLDEVEKGLSKGFRKLKKEVPDTKVPFIYSQVSAFNESIILVDSLLGISLDKYMGEDYPLYKRFYYDYQCRSMRPERIVPDCFAFYLLSRYGMNYHEGTCLIDLMMHSGKINYVVQNLLGYSDIGEAMGYSKEENDWCKENEREIWNYICTNDHLHARDPMVIRYYMKPAPAVDMLGAQAPALIGTWMGARIIASYMKKHKDMKLKDLLEFTDYHVMLSESNYLAS